jgi:DNA polymerase elongation subunit (family B)
VSAAPAAGRPDGGARLGVEDDPLLFGRNPRPGLLAFAAGEDRVRVWRRSPDGTAAADEPFRPFMLLAAPGLVEGAAGLVELRRLAGPGRYAWLAHFDSWTAASRARDRCRRQPADPAGPPHRFLADPVHQHLLLTGTTSFRGMGFGDLRRLALDIEVVTGPGFEFPNALRESDRIVAIALADSTGWETVLSGTELGEAELLAECGRLLRARDPDVIEGHNIFRFDLEYIERRARRHGVPLAWGRDGTPLRGTPARMQVAERSLAYRRYTIAGRHVVDTWLLAQLYDVGARDLPGYGLKEVARHFGVAAPDRTYLPPEDIPRIFREDPARLLAYALDDVRETLAISALLSESYFVQAQCLPFDYESVVLRGNATKIDALLLREYLHQGAAIPAPSAARPVGGGHTAMLRRGVADGVLHVDVQSLYPSLMLARDIAPAGDRLGVFGALLRGLREYRLAAKRLARAAADERERARLAALQQTFKILINSFYGYLAFGQGHWNDFEAANRVTAEGRALVTALVERLEARGALVIEVDTDGLYFVPPPDEAGGAGAGEAGLLAWLGEGLPAGIQLELDGPYPAMLSYKMKNYALLDRNGRLLVKGSSLRSRGLELFQRQWTEECLRLLLSGRRDELPALLARWEEAFRRRRVDVRQFMKTETLQESPAAYREKVQDGRRSVAAAYELAERAGRPYQAGDQVSYYVSGTGSRVAVNEAARLAEAWDPAAPDENTEYYVAKLRELAARFQPFVDRPGLFPPEPEEPDPQAELPVGP